MITEFKSYVSVECIWNVKLSQIIFFFVPFSFVSIPQVTTLVNTSNKGPSSKKKGRSKKAHVLAVSVEQATQNFLEKGEQIAKDSQDLKEELIAAVEDVRKQGEGGWGQFIFRARTLLQFFCVAALVINWWKTPVPLCNIPCVYHQTPIIPFCPPPALLLSLFWNYTQVIFSCGASEWFVFKALFTVVCLTKPAVTI